VNITELIEAVMGSRLLTHPDKPITAKYIPGESKLCVILGDNATGKSMLRRIIYGRSNKNNIECMTFSVQGKTKSSGIQSVIYGDEADYSTGRNAASLLLACIRNSKGWSEGGHAHNIIWDEPSLGLSDSWSASAGVSIREFIKDAPLNLGGAFLITHSQPLLIQVRELNPHLIVLEDECNSIGDWLEKPIVIRPIDQLIENNKNKHSAISKVLNELEAKK